MSNTGKFKDKTPFIPQAGITTALAGIGTDQSIRQDIYYQVIKHHLTIKPRTHTPEHIKKFRKSTREVPGVKQIHYGIYDIPKDYENIVHGVKTSASDHVTDCIKGKNHSGINHFQNQLKESKYHSLKREPLGHPIIRDYKFPEQVTDENFKFGLPTKGSNTIL